MFAECRDLCFCVCVPIWLLLCCMCACVLTAEWCSWRFLYRVSSNAAADHTVSSSPLLWAAAAPHWETLTPEKRGAGTGRRGCGPFQRRCWLEHITLLMLSCSLVCGHTVSLFNTHCLIHDSVAYIVPCTHTRITPLLSGYVWMCVMKHAGQFDLRMLLQFTLLWLTAALLWLT